MIEQGFIYQIVNILVQSVTMVILGGCLDLLLTGREDRGSKRKRIICWSVFCSTLVCIKCLFSFPGAWFLVLNSVLGLSGCLFMLHYFYNDQPWIKFTHYSILQLQNLLADGFLFVFFGGIKELEFSRSFYGNPYLAERSTMVTSLTLLLNVLYTMAVLKIRKKKSEINLVWIASLLPLFLVFLLAWKNRNTQYLSRDFDLYIILLCICTILEFSLGMLWMSQIEKRKVQVEEARLSQAIALEKVRYEQIEIRRSQAIALEKVRYEQIEIRREEMAKLRHDYNNILTSVLFLLKNERTDEAEETIKALLERIHATEE